MGIIRALDGEEYDQDGVILTGVSDFDGSGDRVIIMSWSEAQKLQDDLQDLIWAYHDKFKGER